jgi:hypothetical protein
MKKSFTDIEREAIARVWLSQGFNPHIEKIPPTRAPVRPRIPITSPNFDYTPARATNVAETWRKHGWKAPLKPLCP